MVRLDRRARALEADALDHVRVERPLEEPLDLALVRFGGLELGGLLLEDVDERVPDDLALLFRVVDALQAGEEEVRRVDDGQVHAEVLVEHGVHLRRFVATEHAVIDHDGVESDGHCLRKRCVCFLPYKDAPIANGFVHQFRSDRAIDTAADGTNNPTSFTAYFADASNLLPYKLFLRRQRHQRKLTSLIWGCIIYAP